MRQKRILRYGLTFLACIGLLILATGLTTNLLVSKFKQDVEIQLVKNTQDCVATINRKINSDIGELERLSVAIAALGGPLSNEAMAFISQENWANEDVNILVSDSAGSGYFAEGNKINIKDEEFFKNAVKGNTVVKDLTSLGKDINQNSIVITTPIKNAGSVTGTISVIRDIKFYLNSLNSTVYSGESSGNIINAEDMSIIAGEKTVEFSKNSELVDSMKLGEGGFVSDRIENGETVYLSYEPIDINGWYFLNYIDSTVFDNRKAMLRTSAGAIAVIATALFAVLLVGLYASEERRNKLIEKDTLYHHLTGLPNWRYLMKNFSEIVKEKKMVYLLMRIPDFRRISSVFGYPVAAQLLRDIASEFDAFLVEEEIGVHVSEDCFALLLLNDGRKEKIEQRINNIFNQLGAIPVKDSNIIYDYHCSFSGGAYVLDENNDELSVVNRRANSVLESQSKDAGIFWGWYEAAMNDKVALQESLLPEIMRALQNDEFIPFFQPKYDMTTGDVVGAEVLARWNHPVHGILLPGMFVPLLEASGCVLELDLIMLEQACKMLSVWLSRGIFPVPMSVNISRLNIHRRDFVNRVLTIVKKYDIPTNLIALEMTETAITENSEKISALAKRMKDEGFILSMDDFGHGSSSFTMLKDIHVDIVKLSRNFLLKFKEGERSTIILSHIVNMVHELEAEIVAEGIETKEQEEMVKQIGCKYVQGFLYNRPMGAEDFEKLMTE